MKKTWLFKILMAGALLPIHSMAADWAPEKGSVRMASCDMSSCDGMAMGKEKEKREVEQSVDKSPIDLRAAFEGGVPKVGENYLTFTAVEKTDQEPLVKLNVFTKVYMLSMDMGTEQPAVRELGRGRYRLKVKFTMAGPWRVELAITMANGKTYIHHIDYDVSDRSLPSGGKQAGLVDL